MYEEHTGVVIDDIVIMMISEDGQVELFEKKTKDYLGRLDQIMTEFYDNLVIEMEIAV